MDARGEIPDFTGFVESITDAVIVSSNSQHSIVIKITLGAEEICALKIVFIYDGEKEENKKLRPLLMDEERGKTTTSPDEFYDECKTQEMIYGSSPVRITPKIKGYKILTREEANALIDKLTQMSLSRYRNYLNGWLEQGYSLGCIAMELLGPEFQSLDKIVQSDTDPSLKPYLPKMFAIILFMEYKLNKLSLDPNLGNFMAIRGDPSSVLVIDLAETIPSNIHLTPSDITQNTVEYCINKINRNAFNFLKTLSNYPLPYGPYKPFIDLAFAPSEKEKIKLQIIVELNKLTRANTPIYHVPEEGETTTDETSGPPTKNPKKLTLGDYQQPQGPVYGGKKRTRRKPTHNKRRRKRTRRKRTQRKRR